MNKFPLLSNEDSTLVTLNISCAISDGVLCAPELISKFIPCMLNIF